ncbi:M48 family metalloprotease [uncultured Desulfuromonas sp.]|uniref:M48 family metalloprotease n=1 Tax=uncultured Desulfuromonas sp. TaxID=181013 RepID=UPI00262A669F|nr:M48 family metalloprotease [uncultured Desulfuromonas sp.]
MHIGFWLVWVVAAAFMGGCATNPVTGKRELSLVSEVWELQVGAEQYGPARQMQGGDFVLDPELGDYVVGVGRRLAAVSDRGLPYEFVVINDSTPNAWALPGGKIAINRGLLSELNSEAELAAVLGHEIVHSAARHGAKGMQRGLLMQGAVLAAGLALEGEDYASLAVGGAQLAAGLLGQRYSREDELEADLYGMEYLARANYDPRAAVTLQEYFASLADGRESNWLEGLFSSHPPSAERVAANEATARRLPPGGETAEERYRRKIARILETREAYGAYDEGRKALAEGDLDGALALAEKALAAEPGEALFHGLRGDVRLRQSRYRDALINYDRALSRNDGFFDFYLQRGTVRRELGDRDGAAADLKASVALLPTAPGLNALGDLALQGGDVEGARVFFAQAAGSPSEAGRRAALSLARLDLPHHPERFLTVRTALDRDGYLVMDVVNGSPLAVDRVAVKVSYGDSGEGWRQVTMVLPGGIVPGGQALLKTRIRPPIDRESGVGKALQGVRARVVEAYPADEG